MVRIPPDLFNKYRSETIFGATALLVILLDQFTKYLVLHLKPEQGLGILTIHLIQNTGAGFGMLKDYTFILGLISLCAALAVLFSYKKIEQKPFPQIFFGLFLGGAIGNMLDRFFRQFVVDFIDLGFWPAFNVADACITIAVIGLVIWYGKKKE